MLTQRHKMLDQLRAIPVAWLIVSAGLSLIVTLVFVLGSVSAQAAQPAMQAAGAWDIEQQAIVIAEVDVRNEATVALLQSLGYACAVGVCKLELPDGEELTLIERGLSVRIVGRAIKVAGSARAAAALEYEFGSNHTAVSIPDGATTCGPAVHSDIPLSAAPAGATVSYITPRLRIAHPYVGDLKVSLQNGGHTYDLWNRYGGTTDGDHDDDSEDDDDIELGSADWEVHTFDGDPVRQTWRLYAQDCAMGWTGNIDFWIIYVFYDCAGLTPHVPISPSPADDSTNQLMTIDLNWADVEHATGYDVYFGASAPPPKIGSTTVSEFELPTLTCNTHYYWQVVAKNKCDEKSSAIWDFTTKCCVPDWPASPSPANNAQSVSPSADLDWSDAAYATSYDVYFGSFMPPPKVGTTAASSYALERLAHAASYKWHITAKNACGEADGPLWTFTTCLVPASSPGNPTPAEGAVNQPLDVDLDWTDTPNATSYDVYFGASASPPKVGSSTSSSYSLGTLTCATHYYWKIVAKNACGETVGAVWDFTTTCCLPTAPANPSPSHGATNQTINVDIDWPNIAGATSYDVYFGTAANPPFVGNTTASAYALPTLTYDTRYYWKIVAKNACGDTAGPVWTFTTQASAAARKVHLPMIRHR